MHVHISLITSFCAFLGVLVWGFFWRVLATHNAGNNLGQAMSFIY